MRIQSVIDRALREPAYAAELATMARRASAAAGRTAAEDDAFGTLLAEFADGPEELARLRPGGDFDSADHTVTTTMTTMTITTTTTLACSTTTTTSTTSVTSTTVFVEA